MKEKLIKPVPGFTSRQSKKHVFSVIVSKGKKNPPTVTIPVNDEVYMTWTDLKTKEEKTSIRAIRYARGESSIFVDEQSEGAEKRQGEIIFINGQLMVDEAEVTKLKYLQMCNYNKSNIETKLPDKQILFEENKAARESEDFLVKKALETRLQNYVLNLSNSEVSSLNLSLGFGAVKTDSDLKRAKERFIKMIEFDPERFNSEIASDLRLTKLVIYKGIEYKLISFDNRTNIFFSHIGGGKNKILECKSYVEPYDFFATLAREEGHINKFFEDLKVEVEKLDKFKPEIKEEAIDASLEVLVKDCIDCGIIKQQYGRFDCNHESIKSLGKDLKSVYNNLNSSPVKLNLLKKMLEDYQADNK